jgi:LuxR family maltose regulon positive regulatory protein
MRISSGSALRSPQAWWRISAAAAVGAALLATARGHGPLAAVFALWAIVSLYGSVDHLVEPALAELLDEVRPASRRATADPAPALTEPRRPQELEHRQRRVLRLLAYGLPDDEIAELLELDRSTVAGDVDLIVAHLGVADRTQVVEAARRKDLTSGRGARPAA